MLNSVVSDRATLLFADFEAKAQASFRKAKTKARTSLLNILIQVQCCLIVRLFCRSCCSNLTLWSGSKASRWIMLATNIYYGVREFGMSGIMNGASLHVALCNYGRRTS